VRYGHFDDAAREYVIERPDTPLPWINYLGSDEFFALCSNTAGGYAFYRDARLRRLVRYRYNNAPLDVGGRFLYLRDDESGDWWNPGWQPSRRALDAYTCRHGLGYTVIAGTRGGIRVETTYLVPPGQALEAWRVRVVNERPTTAKLSLVGAVEFCLWDAQDDATNYQRNYSTGEVLVEDGAVYHLTEYRERRDHFAWFASSAPVASSDTSRDAFLGPHRGWDAPLALETGTLSGSVAHGWQPIGALQAALELAPGESRDVTFLLGYTENPPDAKFSPPGSGTPDTSRARAVIAAYREPGRIDADLAVLRAGWDTRLGILSVATGNEHVDRMVNTWNPYQCVATFNLSRSASMFESGIGRGMGFRDSNQDLLGFVHMLPERARERLLDTAATQLPDGGAYHQYQPLTKRGNNEVGAGFNDDPLWLVLAVAAYLKETGDRSILDEPVPWDNVDGTETPLREHLRRSIDYTLGRLGPHGLPLIGKADWNDCLNLNVFSDQPGTSFQAAAHREGGVAESVFIAALFVLAAREWAAVAQLSGDTAEAERSETAANAMTDVIAVHGWDGAWYRRAYDHFGRAVGSAENAEGQLFIEPQGLMAMAGVGLLDGRTAAAAASVRERLATPHGIVLLQPAYRSYHIELGEISSYPPGYKENAGVFCHTNPWMMIAEAILGNGEGALDYYLRINPSAREAISDVHRCEPYVYAQMIAGRDAPTHGEAKNSWLTGTAAWNLVAITQWILGIRPEHDGLRIAPVIPAAWPGFTAVRVFRGTEYEITVTREAIDPTAPETDGAPRRVPQLLVDGRPVAGTVVPLPPPGTRHVRVEVHLA
jgi:cellobiose phosphorylase